MNERSFAEHVGGLVKRISLAYDHRGLLATVGTYHHGIPGSGALLNEVGRSYDGFRQISRERQAHGGAVVPCASPLVAYGYEPYSGMRNSLTLTKPLFREST